MKKKKNTLHTARLNNNCPECFKDDGLELTFSETEQKRTLGRKETTFNDTLYCHSCKHTIYPVNWTPDIEKVYEYHKKQAVLTQPATGRQPLLYGLIVLGVLIFIAALFFLLKLF